MRRRHAETDARWYAYDAGEELVLVYPDSRFQVMAVITASRALELIKEARAARCTRGDCRSIEEADRHAHFERIARLEAHAKQQGLVLFAPSSSWTLYDEACDTWRQDLGTLEDVERALAEDYGEVPS